MAEIKSMAAQGNTPGAYSPPTRIKYPRADHLRDEVLPEPEDIETLHAIIERYADEDGCVYVRVAYTHPMRDVSVVGSGPPSCFLPHRLAWEEGELDLEEVIEKIEDKGNVVEFSATELDHAYETDDLDSLPAITAGAVCTFGVDNIEQWVEDCVPALVDSMAYPLLGDPKLRVWLVRGEQKDVDDFEGEYVVPEIAHDITPLAEEAIRRNPEILALCLKNGIA